MHVLRCFLALVPFTVAALADPNTREQQAFFYKGHDLSSLKIQEDGYGPGLGAIYKDAQRGNTTRPIEDILGDGGMNTVRLRLWVNPKVPFDGGYFEGYSLDYTLTLAKRFFSKGYRIYLVLYFSDYWADPGQQAIPEGWPMSLRPLAQTLRKYVTSTLLAFKQAGVDVSLVSLGNEIRYGILWPYGFATIDIEDASARAANFSNLAYLWTSARKGVDDAVAQGVKKPQVMIHIDHGWDLSIQERWFGALTANNVSESAWDIFGLTFYPFYGTGATFSNLKNSLHTLAARYKKPLHIVETNWPVLCEDTSTTTAPDLSEPNIPVSVKGQIEWMHGVIDVLKSVPNGLGQGVSWWEPGWLNNTGLGVGCQDVLLFDRDWTKFPKVVGSSRESVNMYKDV